MLDYYLDNIALYPFAYVPDLFLLIAVVSGLVNIRYLNQQTRWLLWLVMLSTVIELIMLHYASNYENNHYLINLTSLVETVCLSVIYGLEIENKASRRWIIIGLAGYLITFFYAYKWTQIAEYMIGVQRLLMIFFVILHFQYLLNNMRVPNLLAYTMFWVSAGVMLYASGTLFIFLFVHKTLNNPLPDSDFTWYLGFTRVFTCLFYTIIATSFWLRRREARQTLNSYPSSSEII